MFAASLILIIPLSTSVFAQEYKTFSNVGSDAGDGTRVFDVQYLSVKTIVSSSVHTKDKSIDFVLVGKADSNSTLILKLPKGLITGPFLGIWLDNVQITNYNITEEDTDNLITIPIAPLTEKVSIVGTTVVPEFGPVAGIVLAISILAIVVTTRSRFRF